MPALLLAWALLLALARAAPLFQAEQAVLAASLNSIETASTTTPRPDRTAYFDPRAGGGAQYNVSDSIYRSEPLLRRSQQAYHPSLLCVLIKQTSPNSTRRLVAIAESLGRSRTAQHHHLGAVERRRTQRIGFHRLFAFTRCGKRQKTQSCSLACASRTPDSDASSCVLLPGLWNECANLHLGDPQEANLGDGQGAPLSAPTSS